MRPIYILLKFILKYALWVYYPRIRVVNPPKKRFARTVFASNHAAAFMDPLVVAGNQPPIVFFLTRSDVFTTLLKPILWAAHMLPIYRSIDGEDTKAKNETVFKKCYKILKGGRSLIIFSEGFTDDVFIRRLKPIKKGAVRIGFGACESINWKKNIYLQAVGANYANPNTIGSSVVVSNGDPICLNDYKEAYLDNPNKVITELTKELEIEMRAQLTDVRDKKWAPFHEKIMRLTKKGMNAVDSDKSIPLLERWEYSKNLANWINDQNLTKNKELLGLRDQLDSYFDRLKKAKLEEVHVTQHVENKWSKVKDILYFIFLFPVFVIGIIHNLIPYKFTKNFVEKSFKRKVFWGSVKMMLGVLIFGVFNILLLTAFNFFLYQNAVFWLIYYFIIPPITGVIAYNYRRKWNNFQVMKKIAQHKKLGELISERQMLIQKITKVIPFA